MRAQTLFLDVDGVLLDSLALKANAFVKVLKCEGHEAELIRSFHYANGGMDRHTKLERMQAEVLGRPVSKEVTSRLTKEYANLMQSEFTSVPLMPGAREFLIKHHLTKVLFAVSEAPHNEVVTALRAKGIDRFFSGIQGFPPTKATSIVALLKKHNLEPSLARLIGDSWTDQSAAEKSGLDFVQINGDARIRLPDALCYSSLGEIPD